MTITFDSNVLIYASGSAAETRHGRALDVLGRAANAGTSVLLFQTLGEFSHVALRKYALPMHEVKVAVDSWSAVFPVHTTEKEDLAAALEAVEIHHLQFWDAMLWAAARRVGVRYLLTEDFHDGQVLDGMRFLNPFNPDNDALIDQVLPA